MMSARRWSRFGLRSLLMAVLVVSIGIGHWADRARCQRRACDALNSIAGMPIAKRPRIGYRDRFRLLPGFLPAEFRRDVISVDMQMTDVTEQDMAHLADLPYLEDLNLGFIHVSDAGLVHLSNLTRLKVLTLYGARLSPAGLSALKSLSSLEHLAIGHVCETTGDPVADMRIEEAAIKELKQALPNTVIKNDLGCWLP